METSEDSLTKQYNKQQIIKVETIEKPCSPSSCSEDRSTAPIPYTFEERHEIMHGNISRMPPDSSRILYNSKVAFERMACSSSRSQMQNYVQIVAANTSGNTESKQMEVLKAAKSLFSKRTRTLFHWMYPNAPKPQIKAAVLSSWESLGVEEKEFYISQVLGRFGFSRCNLMVNPQLGGIKELPPLPDTDFDTSPSELQNAISSILSENTPPSTNSSDYPYGQNHRLMLKRKRKQGRPIGSKNRKFCHRNSLTQSDISQDFQDDPELSKELEKFALTLNMNEHFK